MIECQLPDSMFDTNQNLSQIIQPNVWRKLRDFKMRSVITTEDVKGSPLYLCQLCGKFSTKVDMHEQWVLSIEDRKRALVGLNALCSNCHFLQHIECLVDLSKLKSGKVMEQLSVFNSDVFKDKRRGVDCEEFIRSSGKMEEIVNSIERTLSVIDSFPKDAVIQTDYSFVNEILKLKT